MYINKLSPLLFLVLAVITILFFTGIRGIQAGKNISHTAMLNPCPRDDKTNRAIMKEYLTIPEWESARRETNTEHLTPSEIRLVKAPEFSSVCEKFNTQYHEAFSEAFSDKGRTYKLNDVSYYKVGDYFFVIISLRQHSGFVASGVAYLDIYDKDANLIEAYAF